MFAKPERISRRGLSLRFITFRGIMMPFQLKSWCKIFLIAGLSAPAVLLASDKQDNAIVISTSSSQDLYSQIMRFREGVANAKTEEERGILLTKIKQARANYLAANPVKELSPEEKEERLKKIEETLKKDPFQWQMYQLHQSLIAANTQEEREAVRTKMEGLQAERAAKEEASLTPEQQTERRIRQEEAAKLSSKLEPLIEQLRAAKTDNEREDIHAQILAVLKNHH